MWHPGAHTALVQQPHALPTHFQNLAGGMIPISLSLYQSSVGPVSNCIWWCVTTMIQYWDSYKISHAYNCQNDTK